MNGALCAERWGLLLGLPFSPEIEADLPSNWETVLTLLLKMGIPFLLLFFWISYVISQTALWHSKTLTQAEYSFDHVSSWCRNCLKYINKTWTSKVHVQDFWLIFWSVGAIEAMLKQLLPCKFVTALSSIYQKHCNLPVEHLPAHHYSWNCNGDLDLVGWIV